MDGVQTLYEAAAKGNLERVRQLLDAGEPVDKCNARRGPPPHSMENYKLQHVREMWR